MNKKLSHLLEPRMQLYFVCLLLFAAVTAFFQLYLGLMELALVVVLYLYYRDRNLRRRREITKYIENVTCNMDDATRDTMLNAPLPMVIFRPETDEVIWSNERFLQITGEREHMFDTKISTTVPGFFPKWLMEGKSACPDEVTVGVRRYLVFGHLLRSGEAMGARGLLATTYWVDVTDLANTRDKYAASRPVAAILMLDNYEELCKGVSDNAKSTLLADIGDRLDQWVAPTQGLLCKYDRDRYLLVLEEQHFAKLVEAKFDILDQVHQVVSSNGITASLSIGIGRDAPTMSELFQYAALAIEMSLSRGGDQAVIKNQVNFEFYGGRSKEMEKRTKVKSRVMANALGELVASASRVFIMGHKYPDLDAIGASIGVAAIARKKGVPAHIVRDPDPNPATVMVERISKLPEYESVFLSPQDALILADSQSLLVVVDTNRPEQVQAENLLDSCTKVAVIDHHRRAATYIANAALNFHEPYASSASELVTELLQYLMEPADLLRGEAEALMAGIVLDTKNFTMRTGGRTFEAAAFLRRSGADTAEVKKLFQNDLAGTVARYDIIRTAKLYRDGVAIAAVDHPVSRVTAAQAADELLSISGVEASVVLFPDPDSGKVIVSARSMGEINVQVILEKLGGGGNAAIAGAQVPGRELPQVVQELRAAIDQYFADEDEA